MSFLGCVEDDGGGCASSLFGVMSCAELDKDVSELTLDRRRWVQEREAEYSYSGSASSGYHAWEGIHSGRGRATQQVSDDVVACSCCMQQRLL